MLEFFCLNVLVSCFFLVLSSNLIYSLVFLIFIFINSCFIFGLFSLTYFSCIFLIISVGAVGVFFLFVIMNTTVRSSVSFLVDFSFYVYLCFFFVFSFFIFFFFSNSCSFLLFYDFVIVDFISWEFFWFSVTSLIFFDFLKISILVFTFFYLYLVVGCFILFISMLGSIIITNYKTSFFAKQMSSQTFFFQNDSTPVVLKKRSVF